MNATIQCLCHISNIKKYFQDKQLIYNDINNKKCELTKEFSKLINNLWKEPSENKEYYTPNDFKNCLCRMNPLFKGIAASNSKDLIIFLFKKIHNEINKKNQYNYNNLDDNLSLFRNDYYSNNSSFLIDTFYFEQQNELCCFNCGFSNKTYNIANIIIFPLEKVREYMVHKSESGFMLLSLENCFDYYQQKELLSGTTQVYCINCHRMSNATKENKLLTCPQVMTIILNRSKEYDINFEYPPYLNIDKYVITKPSNETTYRYELICILSHYGKSSMSENFIAFCKSPVDGKWYCYNDSIVTQIDEPTNQNNTNFDEIPYILFYQRTDLDKKQNSNNNIYSKKWVSSETNENINNKNDNNNKISLYFYYYDKEFYLDVDENIKIKDLINNLKIKYDIGNNFSLYFEKGNDFIELESNKTINDYDVQDGDKLTLLQISFSNK